MKKEHHPWCNFFTGPVETCKMCKRLYEEYPLGDGTTAELIKKHFPDVKEKK